jgi:RNA polymerase sigma factor (sigma-70 family)
MKSGEGAVPSGTCGGRREIMVKQNESIHFAELVAASQLGDSKSVDRLVRQVEPRLRAYIYRSTLDRQSIDDLMQETLLKMIKSLHNLKKRESLWPWLFNVASNVINDHFRKHRYSKVVLFSTLKNDTWEENLQYDYNKFGDDPARRELSAMVGESISISAD